MEPNAEAQEVDGTSPSTILVVDDDPEICEMLSLRLSRAGYEVVTARDGAEAVELAQARTIDLIVLDIMMPQLSGYEVLERVRRLFGFVDLPVIMLSAKDAGEDIVKALHLGANDYAIKPVKFDVLLERIAVHLALKAPKEHVLGGYRIKERIGEGGMGIVYRALDKDGNEVALKALPRSLTIDAAFVKRFQQEAALASRIDHPNVVGVVEAGVDGETHFIAMELVQGADLADLMELREIGLVEALQVTRQVSSGLEALRQAGVLHRDIKPENIIVTPSGIAKITDFGVARDMLTDRRFTEAGVGIGSVTYASPEQIDGKGDFRSDIYSLGCTTFFVLTGHDPFPQSASLRWLIKRKRRRPPRVDAYKSGLPSAVVALVQRMMDPDANARFRSYDELIEAIDQILAKPFRRPSAVPVWVWPWAGFAIGIIAILVLMWAVLGYG